MSTRTYRIPEHKLAGFVASVDTLGAKVATIGGARPVVEVVGWETVADPRAPRGAATFRRFATVEVSTPAATSARFRLLGAVEHQATGNLVWASPDAAEGFDVDLRRFRTGAPACEHCNTARRRGNTFIVLNLATGAVAQVGRDCMLSATGISDAVADLVRAMDHVRAPAMEDRETWPTGSAHYSAPLVLSAAAALIRLRGFQSSKAADADGLLSTAHILRQALIGWRPVAGTPPEVLAIVRGGPPEAEDMAVARGTRNMAAAIDPTTASDFDANVFAACAHDTISETAIGIACAAVRGFLRERDAQRMAIMGNVSGHFGAVGDRLTPAKLTKKDREAGITNHAPVNGEVVSVAAFDGMYGTTWLVKMLADSGHVFAWRASTDPGVKAAQRVEIRGTVKAHAEYKGTPETVLTRGCLVAI